MCSRPRGVDNQFSASHAHATCVLSCSIAKVRLPPHLVPRKRHRTNASRLVVLASTPQPWPSQPHPRTTHTQTTGLHMQPRATTPAATATTVQSRRPLGPYAYLGACVFRSGNMPHARVHIVLRYHTTHHDLSCRCRVMPDVANWQLQK